MDGSPSWARIIHARIPNGRAGPYSISSVHCESNGLKRICCFTQDKYDTGLVGNAYEGRNETISRNMNICMGLRLVECHLRILFSPYTDLSFRSIFPTPSGRNPLPFPVARTGGGKADPSRGRNPGFTEDFIDTEFASHTC
ncbi:hypothetical protein NPIL_73181 [Nephila pilipes]|uniref:Uncharacterized protein n=1 Tax=Nephila pilipes TaxID=299642 RepID=A0A8X6T4W7_NEPPI|nr:hypothetical protein NPIL_73181 [Nephila pilipes]